MSNTTPGPWAYDPSTGEIFFDDTEQVYPLIATVELDNTKTDQAHADGHLLAAAPELLAALKLLKASHDRLAPWEHAHEREADEAATAAIAKAEGLCNKVHGDTQPDTTTAGLQTIVATATP